MSKEIICRECHTSNTPGSKFCNNCGTRLPPGTSLICPSCQTPNPKNRFYCDNCGTRLVPDSPPEPEQPEAQEPPTGTGKIFSLPIRPPGDTGELDLNQSVPDWLKGQAEPEQETADSDIGPAPPRRNMPKIEEVGDARQMTDDLPDWLIDEHDSDPIIGSPRIITTEHYMNLIQEPEEQIGADIEDTAEQADLPNWLTDLASPTTSDQVTTSGDQSTTDDALAEWLASISQTGDEEETRPADEAADDAPSSEALADRLAELSQSAPPFESPDSSTGIDDGSQEETADSLSAIIPPDTDSLAGPAAGEPVEEPELESEMFDWLAESLADTGSLSDSSLPAEPEEESAIGAEEITGWLDDADWETPSDDVLTDLADAVAQRDIGPTDESLPDWMADLMSPVDDEAAATVETVEPSEAAPAETQPDWMAEFTASDSSALEQAAESVPDSFEETAVTPPAIEESDEPEPAETKGSGPLPDWLSDLGEDESLVVPVAKDSGILSDLFAPEAAANADLDWMTTDDAVEEGAPVETDGEPSPFAGDTDWLTELVSLGDDALTESEEEPSSPEPEPDLFAAEWQEEGEEEKASPEAEPDMQESDWLDGDSMLDDALREELPDWLDELGPPAAAESPPEPDDLPDSDDSLPEWIAQMKPGSVHTGSRLSLSSDLSSMTGALPDIPEDLAGPDLPDWLQGAADAPEGSEAAIFSLDESPDIPDWLKSDSGLTSEPPDTSSEWTAVLQDLPPSQPVQDRMAKVELPDWILALKPRKLMGGEEEPEPEKPLQEIGPLSGIRDVIDIEPIIAQPHELSPWPPFTVTTEQKNQAILLKQMTLADQSVAEPTTTASAAIPVWTRIVLAGLLVATVLAGLIRPNLLPQGPISAALPVEMAYAAVQNAAGQPVLLAVEFTPAMAGELELQAKMLVAQLEANGSPVVTVSQYAAGTAVAQKLAADHASLGYIPGEFIGLRQMGDCLADAATCTLTGASLASDGPQTLADIGLIIVLTGERDSLVNWIEQISSRSDVPMLAGVTQSLGPVAVPYFDSGQLGGIIAGVPDTVAYQEVFLSNSDDVAATYLSVQTLAQLLVGLLLLLGGLGYGVMGLFKRGDSKQV